MFSGRLQKYDAKLYFVEGTSERAISPKEKTFRRIRLSEYRLIVDTVLWNCAERLSVMQDGYSDECATHRNARLSLLNRLSLGINNSFMGDLTVPKRLT